MRTLGEIIMLIDLLLVYENIGVDTLRLFKSTRVPIFGFALQLVGVIELATLISSQEIAFASDGNVG